MADLQNCEINNYEICGNYIIGIDETKNYIFFYSIVEQKYIYLSTIKNSDISNINRTIANGRIIEQLSLILVPIENKKAEIILEFYNNNDSGQLSGELKSIKKWNEIINNRLKYFR